MDSPAASDTSSGSCATGIESPETIILQWRSKNADARRREFQHLLNAVDELLKSTDSAKPPAMRAAMALMKDEFARSISPVKKSNSTSYSSSAYTDSSYSQEETTTKLEAIIPNQAAVQNLRAIAQRMIAAGYSEECIEAYASGRKTVVDDKFWELVRMGTMSSKSIQRLEWMVQQEMIGLWIHGARACICGLFAGERSLSKQIFQGLGNNNKNIAGDCFMKTVKDSAIQLFNFAEAISRSRRSPPGKLFKILDLYMLLSDLLPHIQDIFDSESGEFIRKRAVELLSSLSDAARGMLSEFEEALLGELNKVVIDDPEGYIHPTTIYVMNYIRDMVVHRQILNKLIVPNPTSLEHICSSDLDFDLWEPPNLATSDSAEFEGQASTLGLHLIWIIVVLKFKLQGKSKQYKNTSLAHLLMTSNVDYIVREIKELRAGGYWSIGDNYENKLISLAKANYQSNRTKILDCFKCGYTFIFV